MSTSTELLKRKAEISTMSIHAVVKGNDADEGSWKEIADIAAGKLDKADNPLKMAPHTCEEVIADTWAHAYGREQAAYPVPGLRDSKYWPTVSRVDNAYGDRNLVCSCPPIEEYMPQPAEA